MWSPHPRPCNAAPVSTSPRVIPLYPSPVHTAVEKLLIVGLLSFSFFFFFFNNSCNVGAEKPLENDKASFLPAFVTRFIISFLIVYSTEAPCPNGKKRCMLIGAVCFPLAGKNKTPWVGKIGRYHRRYGLLLLVS